MLLNIGRHDRPDEELQDRIRAQINASHRFDSFADQRSDNFVKWYIIDRFYLL
jgi:phospholipase D1/2